METSHKIAELAQHLASGSPAVPQIPVLLRALAEHVDIIEAERVRLHSIITDSRPHLVAVLAMVDAAMGSMDKTPRPVDGDPAKPNPLMLEVERLRGELAAEREAREMAQDQAEKDRAGFKALARDLENARTRAERAEEDLASSNHTVKQCHTLLDGVRISVGWDLVGRVTTLINDFKALRDVPATTQA